MYKKVQAPFLLTDDDNFPPIEQALKEPNGLLAIGGTLSPQRLLKAYRSGIFPWFNEDQPLLWWSPDPRAILWFKDYHLSKSFQKILKVNRHEVFFDRNFEQVLRACQMPRATQKETWITEEMLQAYLQLHKLGYAHCIEIEQEGRLLGGLYGVSVGKAFFGESMFSTQPNGSKFALYYLIENLKKQGLTWLDCQIPSEHLTSLGSTQVPRARFIEMVAQATKKADLDKHWGNWT